MRKYPLDGKILCDDLPDGVDWDIIGITYPD